MDNANDIDTNETPFVSDSILNGNDAPPSNVRADALVDPLIGTRIGNYEISFVLGQGAYGAVYRAQDIKLGRPVAIKFLHQFHDAHHEAMFLREAKAIATLGKHPSIVQIYEWGEYLGRNYFVLEYVGSGAAMLLRINPYGLPVEQAARIILDCADALAYAHKQNIVHRDVKPANILLEVEGGKAKLADFGVARLFGGGDGVDEGPGGTPGYVAPEIIDGELGDARSDIFSLGVTFYELLCGRRPFEGHSTLEVLENIREDRYIHLEKRNPNIPTPLVSVIRKAVAHLPADRYRSAETFAEAIRAALGIGASAASAASAEGDPEEARAARTRAYKASEDAKRAGALKLAHTQLTAGVNAFRDGEAHERFKKYHAAVVHYDDATRLFQQAEQRSLNVLNQVRALKQSQQDMEKARAQAERFSALRFAPDELAAAACEEHAARATAGLTEARERYLAAQQLYAKALQAARKAGDLHLSKIRQEIDLLRKQAREEGAERLAVSEIQHAEAIADGAAKPDAPFGQSETALAEALEHYREILRVTAERKRIEEEKASRGVLEAAGIEFVWIPPGEFYMGSNIGGKEEMPAHLVRIERGFWMGKYPVTQEQWRAIMTKNPSGFRGEANLPVENISWKDAQEFIRRLNERGEGVFRLPSEAEWEYACRAGSGGAWCFGDNPRFLNDYAWHPANANGRTHPVGQKQPNTWGLHDMHGNVSEWCEDHWHDMYIGAPTNGDAWMDDAGTDRVSRGGSWCIVTPDCRSTFRCWYAPETDRNDFMGFRICRNR